MHYHLLKENGEWKLREEGSEHALFATSTKSDAMDKLGDYMESREGSVSIHKSNGEFQEQRDYPGRSRSTPPARGKVWNVIGVAAVAALTAAGVVYYYRGAISTDRLKESADRIKDSIPTDRLRDSVDSIRDSMPTDRIRDVISRRR